MAAPPLSPTEFSSAVTAITSAFGDPTRREIYLFAHSPELGVTATEVADRFELHPNVARHHLDKLAAGGYVEITTARPASGAGAGRPSKRYRVLGGDMALEIPVRNDEVIIRLLGRALTELGRERAEELAEEIGTAYGVEMAEAMGPARRRSRCARRCTPLPTPSRPTVSRPMPSAKATPSTWWQSTAPSARPPWPTR